MVRVTIRIVLRISKIIIQDKVLDSLLFLTLCFSLILCGNGECRVRWQLNSAGLTGRVSMVVLKVIANAVIRRVVDKADILPVAYCLSLS